MIRKLAYSLIPKTSDSRMNVASWFRTLLFVYFCARNLISRLISPMQYTDLICFKKQSYYY